MSEETRCFLIEATPRVRLSLRRFHFTYPGNPQGLTSCTGPFASHDTTAPFGEHDARFDANGYLNGFEDRAPPHDDERWPRKCASCDYVFPQTGERTIVDHHAFDTDGVWQVAQRQLYRRADTGEIVTIEEAPAGAIWDGWWMGKDFACHDGRNWGVKLPNKHEWYPGGPSRDANGVAGPSWTTSGEVPNLTASPSIWARQGKPDNWHGFLTNGVLRKC